MKPWKRGPAPAAPVGPRGYTSFDPRDAEREARIADQQRRLAEGIRRVLGWRAWAAPSTARELRALARWWDLEATRDTGAEDRERSASYARNLRERATEAA